MVLLSGLFTVWAGPLAKPAQAATPTGTVVAWGQDDYGQTDVPAGALSGVTAIAASCSHSLALKSDGTVVAWGQDDSGQTDVPAGLSGVVAIAAADHFSVALKSDRTVVAWGNDTYGETDVPSSLTDVIAIAAGGYHTLALKSDGTVVAWGWVEDGALDVPAGLSGVIAIASGDHFGLALKSDGSVVAWGTNYHGETVVPVGLSGVTAIAGGNDHSLALKSDGTVVAWGYDAYGETDVPAGLSGVTAIAGGKNHSLALKSDGTVAAWGDDTYGETEVPAGLSGVTAIAAGWYHNLALTDVVVPGSAWLGGHGVNVCYPADGSPTSCGGEAPVGSPWQCVELAQRLFQSQGWWNGVFPAVSAATDIKTWALNNPLTMKWHPVGDGYLPGPGDLIVSQTSDPNGHVAVVDKSDRATGKIWVAEQNRQDDPAGYGQYYLRQASGSIVRIDASGDQTSDVVLGTVHVISSQTTATPSGGGSVHLPDGLLLDLDRGAAASSATMSLTSLTADELADPIPMGMELQGDAASVSLPTLDSGSSATITFPYDPSLIPSGDTVAIYQDGDWTRLPTILSGSSASAQITASTGYAVFAVPETLEVSGFPSPTLSGPHTVTVTAIDGDGNIDTGYTGMVHFTSSDPKALLPTDYLFSNGDAGTRNFTVTLVNPGTQSITVTDTATASITGTQSGIEVDIAAGSTYTAFTPRRILDTRPTGSGHTNIGLNGPFATGIVRPFYVTGVGYVGGGTAVAVPVGATAITANITVVGATAAGVVAIGPVENVTMKPTSISFSKGETRANNVTVGFGNVPGGADAGLEAMYSSSTAGATVYLIVDVTGYFTPDTSGATYHTVAPGRVLDTRKTGSGHTNIGLPNKFANKVVRKFQVAGVKGLGWGSALVPANATAVTGNLTVTNATSAGYVSLGPTMVAVPQTSTLNVAKGATIANGVTVGLNAGSLQAVWDGTKGSSADLIFDVTGYFTADATGMTFYPAPPFRYLDTTSTAGPPPGVFVSGISRTLVVGGTYYIPWWASGVVGNLTVFNSSSAGYAFISPDTVTTPTSSTVNITAHLAGANGFDVALDSGSLWIIWVGATGSTADVQLDITGYWSYTTVPG